MLRPHTDRLRWLSGSRWRWRNHSVLPGGLVRQAGWGRYWGQNL